MLYDIGAVESAPVQYSSFQDLLVPFKVQKPARTAKTVPIVVDNGSFEMRAGFANCSEPSVQFQNRILPPRTRPQNATGSINPSALNFDRVGDQISQEDWNKDKYFKSAFESNVPCNFSNMEVLLDYSFSKLGLSNDTPVDHPIVMTEPLACPEYSRSHAYELLFETYGTPQIGFGVDSLFSYSYNALQPNQQLNPDLGLVMSCSNEVSHAIPIWGGAPVISCAVRMSYGGFHLIDHLYRSVCIQVPHESQAALFSSRCQEILRRYCYVSLDFPKELEMYCGREEPSVILSLPADLSHSQQKAILSEEERRQRDERQHAQAEKLKLLGRERREAAFRGQQDTLAAYVKLSDDRKDGAITEEEFARRISVGGFDDEEDFVKAFQALQKKVDVQLIKRGEVKDDNMTTRVKEETSLNLIDIPDEQLTEEERKTKRVQRMLKGSSEARIKKKEEKARRQEQQDQEHAELTAAFTADPVEFLGSMRSTLEIVKARRKSRLTSTAPAISGPTTTSGRRTIAANRQRASVLAKMGTGTMEGSTFGADDNDWDIYRTVAAADQGDGQADLSDLEDQEEIKRIEGILLEFSPSQTAKNATTSFPHRSDFHPKIGLNSQRIRTPEILFQPSIIGIDQAGISEVLQVVLSRMSPVQALSMCENIFLCGGVSWIPGVSERVLAEMVSSRPTGSKVSVKRAIDPSVDAWRGAAHWANEDPIYVSRREYEELGPNYIKEHRFGNTLMPPTKTPSTETRQQGTKRRR